MFSECAGEKSSKSFLESQGQELLCSVYILPARITSGEYDPNANSIEPSPPYPS